MMRVESTIVHGAQTALAASDPGTQTVPASESLLPSPLDSMLASGDPMDEIAALLARSSRNDRKESRAMARSEERIMVKETEERVRDMRAQARATLRAGIIGGASQVAGGGLRIGSAVSPSGNDGAPSADAAGAKRVDSLLTNSGEAADTSCKFDLSRTLEGGASVVEGFGRMGAAAYDDEAKNCEEDAVLHESRARMAERRADAHVDDQRDAADLLDKVADFMREMRGAQDSSSKAAIMRA